MVGNGWLLTVLPESFGDGRCVRWRGCTDSFSNFGNVFTKLSQDGWFNNAVGSLEESVEGCDPRDCGLVDSSLHWYDIRE
jgi:hypothetical protein